MRRHPEIGARILLHAGLTDIAQWVRAHHERIDGRGYPDGLGAERDPAGGAHPRRRRRLRGDDRRSSLPSAGCRAEAAREELERCAGSQFDPVVVRAFLEALDGYAVLPSGGDGCVAGRRPRRRRGIDA